MKTAIHTIYEMAGIAELVFGIARWQRALSLGQDAVDGVVQQVVEQILLFAAQWIDVYGLLQFINRKIRSNGG